MVEKSSVKNVPGETENSKNSTDASSGTIQIKSGKSNKLLIVISGTVAGAALVLVGVFAYSNFRLKQELKKRNTVLLEEDVKLQHSLKPTDKPIPTLTPSKKDDIPVGWLKYSKDDICFSFSYPKEVTFEEENIIHLSIWGPSQKKDTEFYDGISLSFSKPLDIQGKTLSDFVDSEIDEEKLFGQILKPKEDITINGIKGYTFEFEGLGVFQYIYLQSGNGNCTVEIIDATEDPTGQGYWEVVEKILSTFEFGD